MLLQLGEIFDIRKAFFGLAILLGLFLGSLLVIAPIPFVLIGIGAFIFAYLLIFRIEIAIIFSLFALEPLRQYNDLAGEIPFHPNGLIGLAIIAGTIWFLLFNRVDHKNLKAFWPFMGFLFICFLTQLFVGEYLLAGLTITLRLLAAFSIFIVLQCKLVSIKNIEWVIAAIIGSQLWSSLVQMSRIVGTTGLTFNKEETVRLGHSGIGTTLALILIVCLTLFLNSQTKKQRIIWGSLTVFFTISLFFSYSRAGWIGFVMGVLLIGAMKHRKLLVLLPILLILAIVFIPGISQRFDDISMDRLNDYQSSTLAQRFTYWEIALQIFQTHPVLGVGFGTENFWVGEYLNKDQASVHNDYLTVLIGTGLIGFIVFVLWFGQWFIKLFNLYKSSQIPYHKAIALAIFAYFFTSLVVRLTDNLLQTTDDMYPLAALMAAALVLERIESNEMLDDE